MEEIDWSKAPEGAEWYCNGNWYRRTSSHWQEHTHSGWLPTAYISPENFSWWAYAVSKPAWDGEGLPPVGTVCALTPLTGETVTVTIKYMGKDWAVVQKGNKECVQALGLCTFRLIRTPEQVAAKEREQAIAEMRMLMHRTNDSIQAAINLYDAGFRKVKP